MSSKSFQFKIDAESKLIHADKPSQRRIEITVQAPAAQPQVERTPLNLSLVIDRSGSMSGGKLEQAKKAANYIINQLHSEDSVSVVAFDDQIWTVSTSLHPNPNNRRELQQAVDRLQSGGSTNLGDGWLRGCQLIGEVQQPGHLNRCLLLTDGEANQGIVDLEELGYHANQINQRGVSTSTFGIGQDYNERLLEHMANQGGGHYYYINNAHDIPVIMAKELEGLCAVTSRKTSLTITYPQNMDLRYVGDRTIQVDPGKLVIQLGDQVAEEEVLIYLIAMTPPQSDVDSVKIEAILEGEAEDGQPISISESCQFSYASAEEIAGEQVDKTLVQRYTKVEASVEAEKALRLEKAGLRQEGSKYLRDYLRSAAPMMEPGESNTLYQMAADFDRGLSPMEQKQLHLNMHYNRRNRREMTDAEKEEMRRKILGTDKPTP